MQFAIWLHLRVNSVWHLHHLQCISLRGGGLSTDFRVSQPKTQGCTYCLNSYRRFHHLEGMDSFVVVLSGKVNAQCPPMRS